VIVANITDEFILGLDVLRTRNVAVDWKCLMLQLGKEEVPLRGPRGATAFTLMQEGRQRCISGSVWQSRSGASERTLEGKE
jgi:hypothetical protein